MKNIKKILFTGSIILLFLVLAGLIALSGTGITTNTAHASDEYSIEDIKQMLGGDAYQYTRIYREDGDVDTLESPLDDELLTFASSNAQSRSSSKVQQLRSHFFDVTTIVNSGRPDDESIVIVIMGDGYTSAQQGSFPTTEGTFLHSACSATFALMDTHPFNLFSNHIMGAL